MTGEKQKFKKEVTLIRFSQKQRVLKSFLIILLSQAKRKERRKEKKRKWPHHIFLFPGFVVIFKFN